MIPVDDDYDAWFRRKVEAGRADIRAGRVSPSDGVEAYFAAYHAELLRRLDESST